MNRLSTLLVAATLSAALAAPVLARAADQTDGNVVAVAQLGTQAGNQAGQPAAQTDGTVPSSANTSGADLNWLAGGGG